ncbi:MAG: hypothetical protein ACP5UN_00810 [Candidatus Micrarchaeia archaeon]
MNDKFALVYSFYTAAFMKSNFENLKNIMSVFPDSFLISDGTLLKYAIGSNIINLKNQSKNIKNIYDNLIIIEFKKDSIYVMFYSTKDYIEKKGVYLLKFLSILEYVKNIYDITLDNIYQDIIATITPILLFQDYNLNQNKNNINNDKRIIELNASNYALSKEIIYLSKINEDQKRAFILFKEFYKQIIDKLSNSLGEDNVKVLSKLGIDKNLLDEIEKLNNK